MKKGKEWAKEQLEYYIKAVGKPFNDCTQGTINAYKNVENIINQLDEPQKPIIPQFVAEWFENDKRDMEIEDVFWQIENCEMVKLDVDRWVSDNRNTFIRAWLDGYEVEKEKKYQVIIRDSEYIRLYLCKHGDNVMIGTNDNYIEKCPEVTYLTEQEIKDYDERYWAFAEEVTE